MQKNKKVLVILIIALIVIIIGITGTYAWYVWSTNSEQATKIVTNVGAATIYFDAGSDITANLKPVGDKTKGILKEIKIKSDSVSDLKFNLYLDVNSIETGLKHESFKFEIYEGNTFIKGGNFTDNYLNSNLEPCDVNATSHIKLLDNQSITKSTTTYKLYIWIDGLNYTNPNSMQNSKFNFKLHAEGQNAILSEGKIPDINEYTNTTTLSYKVIHDYYYADKSTATNNGVAYYLDAEHQLMSDVDGNVRYYGASPNNYVYFNCDTYPDTNCELWRIIGVFNGKIKLVRASAIGSLAWDQDKNQDSSITTYSNNWETSSIQQFLNGLYYNKEDTATYEYLSGSSGGTKTTINLTTVGIKESTRSLISSSTWYLGGYITPRVYTNNMYEYEKSNKIGTNIYNNNPAVFTEKIGLMNPSDYGYSTDFSKCNQVIRNYDNSNDSYACRTNNWLYTGKNEWLINQNPLNSYHAWYITTAGYINLSTYVYSPYDIRPTLYLTPDITLVSGTGTSSDPYRIS